MDEYARQLERQNKGLSCEYCGSSMGHSSRCALLTNVMAHEESDIQSSPYYRPERYKAEQLAPYQHELNSSGTACSQNCPCCTWLTLQELIAKRKGEPGIAPDIELVLTPSDRELLAEMNIAV